jgi:HSP20 family protein
MTMTRRIGPFGDLVSLRAAMDRLFEESFVSPRTWQFGEGQLVPVDVFATDDEIVVQAILPGVKPEEVDITMEANVLLREIRRGRFIRTLNLPTGLEPDKAKATFEDGVLTLRIPKAEQMKPRQIKISPVDSQRKEPAAVAAE